MSSRLGSDAVHEALARLSFQLPERSAVPEIESLLNRSVLWGGKRLRPLLTFLVADSLRVDLRPVAAYARAAEFTHAATLAHDDVIDEAMVRRHRPTLNSRASNSRAVLAGDFLLAQALKELCANPSNGPTRTLISGLSQVLEDMVSGEWLQLEARGVVEVSAHHLDEVARKKTASLLAWCCSVGPVLAELSDSLVLRLRELGIHLGIAFQQVDDVLDFQVGGEKPFAQDIREGLVNRVGFELIRANPSLAEPLRRTIALWRHSSAEVALQSPWPWQEKELEAARHVVRLSAQAHIEAARELWNGVISELSLERSNPSVQAIYRILDELPGRRK